MTSRFLLGAVACIALLCTGMEESEISLEGVTCAVNANAGAKADKFAEYREANVYFCCGNCLKKFNEDSDEYSTVANHQLVRTGQFEQTKCPISGRDINPAQKNTVGEVEVTYCCGGCKSKVDKAADAEAQAELVFANEAFEKGFAKAAEEEEEE